MFFSAVRFPSPSATGKLSILSSCLSLFCEAGVAPKPVVDPKALPTCQAWETVAAYHCSALPDNLTVIAPLAMTCIGVAEVAFIALHSLHVLAER